MHAKNSVTKTHLFGTIGLTLLTMELVACSPKLSSMLSETLSLIASPMSSQSLPPVSITSPTPLPVAL